MKKLHHLILFFFFSFFAINSIAINDEETSMQGNNSVVINRITSDDIIVTLPSIIFPFTDTEIKLKFKNPRHGRLILNNDKIHFIINGEDTELTFIKGEGHFKKKFDNERILTIYTEGFSYTKEITVVPLWALLLPVALILFWSVRRMRKKQSS